MDVIRYRGKEYDFLTSRFVGRGNYDEKYIIVVRDWRQFIEGKENYFWKVPIPKDLNEAFKKGFINDTEMQEYYWKHIRANYDLKELYEKCKGKILTSAWMLARSNNAERLMLARLLEKEFKARWIDIELLDIKGDLK